MEPFEGTAWAFGDHVNTDVIISARHLVTSEPAKLAPHCFESVNAEIARCFEPGDIIVAGENFGCGSSREHAVLALVGLGAACVIARSYGQIFYRNAFNQGLLLLEAIWLAGAVHQGDRLRVDVNRPRVNNLTQGNELIVSAIPQLMRDIVGGGGLMPYVLKKHKIGR
jgi:3-isopropylmalate/(R)-2-methylmalate dehydratase small subunit